MCVYIHICIHTYTYTYIHIYMCIYVCVCVCKIFIFCLIILLLIVRYILKAPTHAHFSHMFVALFLSGYKFRIAMFLVNWSLIIIMIFTSRNASCLLCNIWIATLISLGFYLHVFHPFFSNSVSLYLKCGSCNHNYSFLKTPIW